MALRAFLRKGAFFLFLAVCMILFSRMTSSAQEGAGIEEKILKQIGQISAAQAQIIDTQSKIQGTLNQVLNNQADIKKELEIVKIRVSLH